MVMRKLILVLVVGLLCLISANATEAKKGGNRVETLEAAASSVTVISPTEIQLCFDNPDGFYLAATIVGRGPSVEMNEPCEVWNNPNAPLEPGMWWVDFFTYVGQEPTQVERVFFPVGDFLQAAAIAPDAECHASPNPVQRWADTTIFANGLTDHYTAGVVIRNEGGDVAATGMDIREGSGSLLYHTVWSGINTVVVDQQLTCSFEVLP